MPHATDDSEIAACLQTLRPMLFLAPRDYLDIVRANLAAHGIQNAVTAHENAVLFNWCVGLIDRQGISNAAAIAYSTQHGGARWSVLEAALSSRLQCPKLRSHWHFYECGFRKKACSCVRPDLLLSCPVPRVPARKGTLCQAAIALALFIRDVCDGDLVEWIDYRLAEADEGPCDARRAEKMREALLGPLAEINGTGRKIWSMILSELLLGADPARERWVGVGVSLSAIDSLVHAVLHRTGILRRLNAEHSYGPACYSAAGCAAVISELAQRIDARAFNRAFPQVFPRWVQFAIWNFAAEGGWNICNGRQIDDRHPCRQSFCPCHSRCDRLPLEID